MKRRFFTLLFAISLTLFLSHGAASTASAKDPYKITLITWDGWDEAAQGFKDYLLGENVPFSLTLRDAKKDASRLPLFIKEAKKTPPDLIATWGTATALSVFGSYHSPDPERHITDTPGLFMVVSQPQGAALVPNLHSSGRNITGVPHTVPLYQILALLKKALPLKRLAFLYTPNEANAVIFKEKLMRETALRGIHLSAYPVPLDTDGTPQKDSLQAMIHKLGNEKADILLLGPDLFLTEHQEELIRLALPYRLPVCTLSKTGLSKGAFMVVYHPYYNIGSHAAKKALQILTGDKTPQNIKVAPPKDPLITFNIKTAEKLGLYPPLSLLKEADIYLPEGP